MRAEPIVLIESNSLLREGLKRILVDGGFEILHSVSRVSDLPDDLSSDSVKDVELKVVLRIGDASQTCRDVRAVRDRLASAVVVVLGDKAGLDMTFQALAAGASAYLDDVTDCEALYKSIELASEGRAVISLDRKSGSHLHKAASYAVGVGVQGAPAVAPPIASGHDNATLHEAGTSDSVSGGPDSGDAGGGGDSDVVSGGSVPLCSLENKDPGRGRDAHTGEGGQLGGGEFAAPSLSPRESAILDLLREGAPNKVIARRLSLTESTVKVHLKAILRKIRVKNRTQAAVWAIKRDENRSAKATGKKQSYRPPEHSLQQ